MIPFNQQHLPKFKVYYLEHNGDTKTILKRELIYEVATKFIKDEQKKYKEFLLIERD